MLDSKSFLSMDKNHSIEFLDKEYGCTVDIIKVPL